MDWTSMVTVGRIVRPHGRVGHVVVASETDFAEERFRAGETLYVLKGDAVEPLTIDASREHQGRWVIGLAGVASIDEAEALRDSELRIPESAVKALGPGTYYTYDLVGCDVRVMTGEPVGRVASVDVNAPTPLLVVVADGQEVLVPMTEAICRRIDVAAKIVEIDPPAGLIDLNWKKPRA